MVARAAEADVVILAAGRSSRLGEPKGLFVVDGRPWLLHQLDAIARVGVVRGVIVVLGFEADRYRTALPDLARRAQAVTNPDPDRGPFSSLQCGLAALAPARRPAFVLPVDVPAASPEVWDALSAALRPYGAAPNDEPGTDAAVPVHEGRGGHPVLLSSAFAAALLERPPTSRLDHELGRGHGHVAVARVPVGDPRVGLNLNEPRDWGKLGNGNLG